MASYADSLFDVTSFYADAATVSFQIAAQVNRTSNSDTLAIKNISTNTVILSFNLGSWSAVGNNQKTITLTSAQRTTLLNAMGNVARFQVQYEFTSYYNGSVIGSNFIYGYIYRSSADSPTINSVSWADTNAESVAVTDNAQIMISGNSNIVFTITATAKANRSISSYTVQQAGGYYLTRNNGTVDMGLFRPSGSSTPGASPDPNTSNTRYTVTVVDNAGNATFQDVFVSYYSYATPPVLSTYNIKRNASDSTKLDISFTGRYTNIATNTVTAKYKYKVAETGSYSAETSLTLTISGDTFSCSTTTGSILAEDSTYEFVLILSDKLNTNNIRLTIPSVVPLITFRPEAVGIGGEPTHTKALDVADGYSLNANGTHNTSKVMPYSFRTNGGSASAGWARIARITLVSPTVGANYKYVIEFTVQRFTLGTSHLKVMFNNTTTLSATVEPTANNVVGFPTTANSAIVWLERVSTDPYTYDIYFPKANADDVLTVYTYCDASFQDRIKIEYADALVATAPSESLATIRYFALAQLQAVPVASRMGLGWNGFTVGPDAPASHTLTLASDWSIVDHGNIQVDGKNNTMAYMPYSWHAYGIAGSNGWARIATVDTKGNTWVQGSITFEITRLIDFAPFHVYLSFEGTSDTDPNIAGFYRDGNPYVGGNASTVFIYKVATHVWDIYVRKVAGGDDITVRVYADRAMQDQVDITFSNYLRENAPAGSINAVYYPQWKYIHGSAPATPTLTNATGTVSVNWFRMWENYENTEYALEARIRISNFARTGANFYLQMQTSARPQASVTGISAGYRTKGGSGEALVPEFVQVGLYSSGVILFQVTESFWNTVSGGDIWLIIPHVRFGIDR